jgi:hypothetical protein
MDTKEDGKAAEFMTQVYDLESITNEEFDSWVVAYSYKGFNRTKILRELRQKVGDPKVVQQIILVCGLLGPQRASQVKLINGRTISSYGIPASGMKGTDGISCQRIISATADLCAYFLKKAKTPRRVNVTCPAHLQFPSAGSLPLNPELRAQHIEFSKVFSTLIGGIFNEQIYNQMAMNTYCDKRVYNELFDQEIITVLPSTPTSSLPPVAKKEPKKPG